MDFSKKILGWYAQNKRDLPWREDKNPYHIWLSEIIMQQTRVAQGTPYFLNFKSTYPSIKDFANANQDDILRIWQGLGYYSRGRNMHFAANQVMNDFNGKFPNTYKELLNLKGVGEYTAAAIASIAFNESVAVVDGNVYRVLSRYFKENTPIDSTEGKKLFFNLAQELISAKSPGDHNQAIMEIGALVCTPKHPNCGVCPLVDSCVLANSIEVHDFPVKSKKIKVRNRYFSFLHIIENDKFVIQQRGAKDIWEGLYQFPIVEDVAFKDLASQFEKLLHLKLPGKINKTGSFKHVLTHQRIFADFYQIRNVDLNGLNSDYIVIGKEDLDKYGLPKLMVNYLESLNKN